jgi:hypothetical protein
MVIRKYTNNNKKAIKKWQECGRTVKKSQSETTIAMQQSAEAPDASFDTTLHRRARA